MMYYWSPKVDSDDDLPKNIAICNILNFKALTDEKDLHRPSPRFAPRRVVFDTVGVLLGFVVRVRGWTTSNTVLTDERSDPSTAVL